MRRPGAGRRIMRGILLIWKKTSINIKHGYIPSWWSEKDINDVRHALRYLGAFYDWYVGEREKGEGDEKSDQPDESGVLRTGDRERSDGVETEPDQQ